MPKRRVTWFVLADGTRARIFERRPDGPGYAIVAEYQSAEAHRPTRDLGADRPGRTQESATTGRHALEPREDWHRAAKADFAREVAAHLNEACASHAFDSLVLYALPQVLTSLHEAFDNAVRRQIKAEVAKDLTKLPVAELEPYFASLG
jgi:protein required for attachment to host cells